MSELRRHVLIFKLFISEQEIFFLDFNFLLNGVYSSVLRPREMEREAPFNAGRCASGEKENVLDDTP